MRIGLILGPIVYALGIVVGLVQDYLRFMDAGGDSGFALMESLHYASFWPLRLGAFLG